MPLRLSVRRLPDGGLALIVDGDVDLFTVPKLRKSLAETLAAVANVRGTGPGAGPDAGPGLVLDLRAVLFVDSAGIDALIGLRRGENPAGIPFAVVTLPTGQVRRVLRLSRLDGYLNLREMAADAELAELAELVESASYPSPATDAVTLASKR